MRYSKLSQAVVFASLCAASVSSQAQTYYSDRTLFNAANPGLTLETFDSLSPSQVVTGLMRPPARD